MKAIKWLDEHLEEAILIVGLVLISVVCLVQVLFNKLPFLTSLTWSEEFCRFVWIWCVFISVPYTIKKGSMLRVSVVLDLLPQGLRKVINLVVQIIVLLSMILMAYYSFEVVGFIKASGELSAALRLQIWLIYASISVGFVLGVIRAAQQVVHVVKHFNEKELTTLEQTMADAAAEAEASKRAEGGAK